jgi:hypothetical protein
MQTSSSVFQVPITDSAPPSLEHVTVFGPPNLICPIHEPFPLGHRCNPISFDDDDDDDKKEEEAPCPPTIEIDTESEEECVPPCYPFALGHPCNPITISSDDEHDL